VAIIVEGWTVKDLALRSGRSAYTVRRWIKALGLSLERGGGRLSTFSDEEAAKICSFKDETWDNRQYKG